MSSIQDHLRYKIISPHLPKNQKIDEDTLLFSSGILDSLSLLEIVQEIEQAYAFSVHWTELNLDHFDSIKKIENYIEEKQNKKNR